MDEGQGRGGPAMNGEAADRTPEEVRAEIEVNRAELGDTVEALVAKTDVKGQAKQAVTDAKATVADKAADIKQTVTAKTGEVKNTVGSKATDVEETVTAKTDEVSAARQQTTLDGVGETGRRAVALAQDNRPVLIAAGIFALGVLIGSRRGR